MLWGEAIHNIVVEVYDPKRYGKDAEPIISQVHLVPGPQVPWVRWYPFLFQSRGSWFPFQHTHLLSTCKLPGRLYPNHPKLQLWEDPVRAASLPQLGRSWVIHLSHHTLVSPSLAATPGAGKRTAVSSLELLPKEVIPPHEPSQNESCLAGAPGAASKVPCPQFPSPSGKQPGLSCLKVSLLILNFTAQEFLVNQVPKPKRSQKQRYRHPKYGPHLLGCDFVNLNTIFFCFKIWNKDDFNTRSMPNQHKKEKEWLALGMTG